MKTIGTEMLATVTGGVGNPAKLAMKAGQFLFNRANNSKAFNWLKAHKVSADEGGNYTRQDGPFPSLYRYLYKIGSRQAPGAAD